MASQHGDNRRTIATHETSVTVSDMTINTAVATTEALTTEQTADLIESVMRLTGDEILLVGFLSPDVDRRRVLGNFIGHTGSDRLALGTPLRHWAYGDTVNPDWRDEMEPVIGSLWEQYGLLVELCGAAKHAADPYEGLCQLMEKANQLIS
jgi:hypothetical protein